MGDLEILTEVVDKNRYKGNSSLEAVTNSFRRLGNNRGKVPKERLLQYSKPEHDLTGGNLDDMLSTIGMPHASLMDCETLARKLLEKVCSPPSMLEKSGNVEEA